MFVASLLSRRTLTLMPLPTKQQQHDAHSLQLLQLFQLLHKARAATTIHRGTTSAASVLELCAAGSSLPDAWRP
jgi:hypothetical protein